MNIFRVLNRGNFFTKLEQSLSVFRSGCDSKSLINSTQHVFFSHFSNPFRPLVANKLTQTPFTPVEVNSRGFKTRGHLQLRCKDCYMVRKDGKMYVLCSSYPRHKQVKMTKRTKYTWILTHAFQSKHRPY